MPRAFKTTNEDGCFVPCDIKQSAHWPIDFLAMILRTEVLSLIKEPVSGHAPIFHLLTGHLLTDICWLDICWLGLDICWLRHLLILATPAICWLWKDVCWFRHLLIQTIADSVKTHNSAFTTAATFPKLPISGTMEVDYINQACHLDIFMKSHENLWQKTKT